MNEEEIRIECLRLAIEQAKHRSTTGRSIIDDAKAYAEFVTGTDVRPEDQIKNLVNDAKIRDDAIARVNHPEDQSDPIKNLANEKKVGHAKLGMRHQAYDVNR